MHAPALAAPHTLCPNRKWAAILEDVQGKLRPARTPPSIVHVHITTLISFADGGHAIYIEQYNKRATAHGSRIGAHQLTTWAPQPASAIAITLAECNPLCSLSTTARCCFGVDESYACNLSLHFVSSAVLGPPRGQTASCLITHAHTTTLTPQGWGVFCGWLSRSWIWLADRTARNEKEKD